MVYLKYLPEEPTPVDTITISDIDAEQGMEVELTRTEDIVTKMNVHWYMTYLPGGSFAAGQSQESQYMILRRNVESYGLWEKDYEWYIFNQPDIVLKMATFWLIRLSTVWKRLKFRTYLQKLNLEAFDCVTFNAPGYIAAGAVPVIVERAAYDSANNSINFECATPVAPGRWCRTRSTGRRTCPAQPAGRPRPTLPPAMPAGVASVAARAASCPWAPPMGLRRAAPFSWAAPTWCFAARATWVIARLPTWRFVAQPLPGATQYAAIQATSAPQLNLRSYPLQDSSPLATTPVPPPEPLYDLVKMKICDSSQANGLTQPGKLSDFIKLVIDPTANTGKLMIDGVAPIVTADAPAAPPFDYKYDATGKKLGEERRSCRTTEL